MRHPFPLLSLLLVAATAHADTFEGAARDPASGRALYTESHYVFDAGTPTESRIVLYRCPRDGRPFARKELRYDATRTAPSFDMQDARSGFAEGLERASGATKVYARAGAGAERRSAAVDEPALVADAGFDEFVRTHWDELQRGDSLRAPFLVPSLLESVDFRVRKASASGAGADRVSVIRLAVAGPLGWFLSDIDVSYRDVDRRLVSYTGVTNIRDARGKMLNAIIDFPDSARRDSAPAAAELRALPLTGACD